MITYNSYRHKYRLYSFFSGSKCFLSTGLTMKWRAEAAVTSPAMVYIVLLYKNGLETNYSHSQIALYMPPTWGR